MFRFAISLVALLFLFSSFTFAQTVVLEVNKPYDAELKGGDKISYEITLQQGKFAEIELEQRGIDVRIQTFELDGKLSDWFDSQITDSGLEKFSIVSEQAGTYRFDVIAKLKTAVKGNFQLRIINIRDLTENDKFYKKSNLLIKESDRLIAAGKYKDALPFAQEALEIREKIFPADDPQIATTRSNLGNIYLFLNDLNKSEPLLSNALAIWQKSFGNDSLNVASVLSNLALICLQRGDLSRAETNLLKTIEVREKLLGKDHTLVAGAYNTLGRVYRRLEKIDKAVQSYEKALDIRERTLGKDDPATANVLTNLSTLYYYNGEFAKSQILDERVLSILEKTLGPEHERVASALDNLGLSYTKTEQFDKSEALFRRALSIYQKTYGVDSPNSGKALINLAAMHADADDMPKAEPLIIQAIRVTEPDFLNRPLEFANTLSLAGTIFGELRDYPKAETNLLRSLEIYKKYLGENHIEVARVYNNLARLYALMGEPAKAVVTQGKGLEINAKSLGFMLEVGSERAKVDYLANLSQFWNLAIGLNVSFAKDRPEASENAVNAIFQNKGRVLDAITASIRKLRTNVDPENMKLLEDLDGVNNELAEIVVGSSTKITPVERQAQLKILEDKKGKIEAQISRLSAGFYSSASEISLSNVRANIPKNAVLLEFSQFEAFRQPGSKDRKTHYVQYIVRQTGKIEFVDLGEAKLIDEAISKFRNALQDSKNTNIKQLSQDLEKRLISPIREFFGDSTQLLVSPDGDLNLIPFEALIDERGKYLVEKYSISYLSSGRDLLRMQNAKPNTNSALIIANPDFGIAETEQVAKNEKVAKRTAKRGVSVAKSLAETYFAPLDGTEQEGKSIQGLFPNSNLLTGLQATKEALKQTKSPSILHIASHGFYLEDKEKSSAENPLLRSGLALAGANSRKENNGIVTALEATGLNLYGTKLVVLSACGTGLGEVQSGEGVFGLRRSFVLAGSESLVISLWSVSDYITRELMTNYYKNLKLGNGRGESLRKVQLEMIKNPKRNHPFYWASFIQSGDWKQL
jgi:CHAT domain-containing protein/Tfp pilus assembly protein PilF